MRKKPLKIEFCNEQDDCEFTPLMREYMKSALAAAIKRFNISKPVYVCVSLANEQLIRKYNCENRNVDKATDVLSFPLQNFYEGEIDYNAFSDAEFNEAGQLLLGDVVICMSVAMRQAAEYGHSVERETVYLFVHSILHLLGFDHEREDMKARMRAEEENIMNEVGLSRDERI